MPKEKLQEEVIEIELTEKQKAFCKEYIWDWNGSRAYKKVYKINNDAAARANASRLLTYDNVKTYIETLKNNLAEVAEISPLMVLKEHKKIAFSSIAHLHNTWIERKEFDELTDEQKECIQEIDTKIQRKNEWEFNEQTGKKESIPYEVEYVKIRLYDKLKSLDSINKMLGWDAPKKIDLSNNDGSLNNLSQYTTDELIRRAEAIRTIEKGEK